MILVLGAGDILDWGRYLDFDLIVNAAENFDGPVCGPATKVASVVHE
jgi:hypothetical protein